MSELVLIRGICFDAADLVYHERRGDWVEYLDADGNRYSDYPGVDVAVRWEIRTRCGLLVDYWTRDYDRGSRYVSLDVTLADRIARPCRNCFDVEDDPA